MGKGPESTICTRFIAQMCSQELGMPETITVYLQRLRMVKKGLSHCKKILIV